jgi:hypothetical protein
MSDVELIKEILCQVLSATRTMARRFAPIVVYSVCAHHIGVLEQTVEGMLADLARR